jgi:deferrochelatase/peroxidase EfeB
MAMMNSSDFEFDDLQGLLRFGHAKLTDTCFMLLNIVDASAAKQWLGTAPVSNAVQSDPPPDTALQIAFSAQGLRALGLTESVIENFSDEFITGMSGDESRSRRLGDVGSNAPEYWHWGGDAKQVPHVLLLFYAEQGKIEAWRKKVEGKHFLKAFKVLTTLSIENIGQIEPFGFTDGISQPRVDWSQQQSTDTHDRDRYSNLLAVGEVVLGYPNEYKQYTVRPIIDPEKDKLAAVLPDAEDEPALKDFARNGSYLVLRQLDQDVPGFWQFIDKAAGSVPEKREQLAAAMVGRNLNGSPLVPEAVEDIPGTASDDHLNRFTFDMDPGGNQCPIGAHIRRANPRTGDLPPGVTGCVTRLIKILGFGGNCQEQDLVGASCFYRLLCWLIKILGLEQGRHNEDLVASSRFHRLLRRGRSYGPKLEPEDAIKPDAPVAERGLQFICLVANISRQFEFVQNAWSMSSKFSGVQQERDPLLGHRKPLMGGEATDQFNRPNPAGPMQITCSLPQFITVRGGGYFFMPGLRALKYLATLPTKGSDISS